MRPCKLKKATIKLCHVLCIVFSLDTMERKSFTMGKGVMPSAQQ